MTNCNGSIKLNGAITISKKPNAAYGIIPNSLTTSE